MPSLSDILKQDIKHVVHFTKGMMKGIVKGAYTPYLVTTSIRDHHRRKDADIVAGERIGHAMGYISTHVFVSFPIIYYAFSEGKGRYYLAALLATNTLDYFYNLNQRRNL